MGLLIIYFMYCSFYLLLHFVFFCGNNLIFYMSLCMQNSFWLFFFIALLILSMVLCISISQKVATEYRSQRFSVNVIFQIILVPFSSFLRLSPHHLYKHRFSLRISSLFPHLLSLCCCFSLEDLGRLGIFADDEDARPAGLHACPK